MEQGPEGWLFFQMRGTRAEYERAKILERTRRGMVGRIRAGHAWASGRAIATRNRKYAYLLCGGRLRCGRCGRGKTGICRKPDNSYYRCNSYHYIIDPVLRCPGVLRADVVESQVWAAVVRALDQPELISTALCTAEARQPHAGHDDRLEKRLRPTPRHGTLGTLALYGEGYRISASMDMHCIVPLHHV